MGPLKTQNQFLVMSPRGEYSVPRALLPAQEPETNPGLSPGLKLRPCSPQRKVELLRRIITYFILLLITCYLGVIFLILIVQASKFCNSFLEME